jgi:hypothetical protein
LVHQVIKDLELSPNRQRDALSQFSQLLYSPVYSDELEAREALTALESASIESPVFSLSGLQQYCTDANLTALNDSVYGLFIGDHTPQVKALLDPTLIPDLIKELEHKAFGIQSQLYRLNDELEDLDPYSDSSQSISAAIDAIKKDARTDLYNAKKELVLINDGLQELSKQMSIENIDNIRKASLYIDQGGDTSLNNTKLELDKYQEKLVGLSRSLPRLQKRDSKESQLAIQSMLEFKKLGGEIERERLEEELVLANELIIELDRCLPNLQDRNEHLSTIQAAKKFMDLGGWGTAQLLAKQVDEATDALNHAEEMEGLAKTKSENTEGELELSRNAHAIADKELVKWSGDLGRAIQFENCDGVSFYATYEERLRLTKIEYDIADQRSRFDFSLAQQAVDAEKDEFFQKNKVKERDDLINKINSYKDRLESLNEDLNTAHDNVQRYTISSVKCDDRAKRILDQWIAVRAITAELPFDQKGATPKTNIFLDGSKQIVTDLLEVCEKELWDEGLELLDCLADNANEFPLSQRKQNIEDLTKRRKSASNSLYKEVGKIVQANNNGLSESEIESLANPRSADDLSQSVLTLHALIESHLIKAEAKYKLNEADVEGAKRRMLKSMAGFTISAKENFALLKTTMSSGGNGASIKISGKVIDADDMKETLNKIIQRIERELSRRQEDIETATTSKESDQAFEDRLRSIIRSDFYRSAFRGDKEGDSSGPRLEFSHPQIGGGRFIHLSRDLSTGQFNALTLLILVKLADYSMRRETRNEYNGLSVPRSKQLLTARTVMIDGLFSNLSDKKMIRDSLSILESLKGNFQLIGWIHNQQYENDYNLFPSLVTVRRTGRKTGYVLAESPDSAALDDTQQVATMETHISPMQTEKADSE